MNRDYAKVAPSFWTGDTGRALRGDPSAQIVAMYLVTCRHANMIGVFECPAIYVSHETGLPLDEALKALKRLADLNFCSYDASTEIVWVKEMAKYQVGESLELSDKRVKHIQKQFKALRNGQIKREFYERYWLDFHLQAHEPEPETASPFEAPSKPLRSQEQEQKQEQKQEQEQKRNTSPDGDVGQLADASGPPAAKPALRLVEKPCPYQALVDLYHEVLPELPRVRELNKTRMGYLNQRWRAKPGSDMDKWRRYFEYIRESDFLMGRKEGSRGRPPFIVNLEWIIKPSGFTNIIEGKYHDREAAYG